MLLPVALGEMSDMDGNILVGAGGQDDQIVHGEDVVDVHGTGSMKDPDMQLLPFAHLHGVHMVHDSMARMWSTSVVQARTVIMTLEFGVWTHHNTT